MRLSCEKYFVLISVFVSYLLFREPPRAARALIRLNSRLSTAFQKVILYSFPAVCWVYGAGFIFSTFVSVVFWGGPLMQTYQALRAGASIVRIRALRPASAADIERMGGNCAICWGEMVVAAAEGPGAAGGAAAGTQGLSGQAASAGVVGGRAGAAAAAEGAVQPHHREPQHPQHLHAQHAQHPQYHGNEAHGAAAGPGAGSGTHFEAAAGVGAEGVAHGAAPMPVPPGGAAEAAAAATDASADMAEARTSSGGGLEAAEGYSLPCSHAYHHACLHQWLHQCHAQGTTPTCPMCQVRGVAAGSRDAAAGVWGCVG